MFSNGKNDWRVTDQAEYLMAVKLIHCKFTSKIREHDHCEFCGIKFSEHDDDLREGYCTLDKYYWICDQCYHDFKDYFKWELKLN